MALEGEPAETSYVVLEGKMRVFSADESPLPIEPPATSAWARI